MALHFKITEQTIATTKTVRVTIADRSPNCIAKEFFIDFLYDIQDRFIESDYKLSLRNLTRRTVSFAAMILEWEWHYIEDLLKILLEKKSIQYVEDMAMAVTARDISRGYIKVYEEKIEIDRLHFSRLMNEQQGLFLNYIKQKDAA